MRYDVGVSPRLLTPGAALTVVVWLSFGGCTKPRTPDAVLTDLSHAAAVVTPTDMNRTAVDAGASVYSSPFALVAIEEVTRLHRLLDGNVLAASGQGLYSLNHEGGVRRLDGVFSALRSALGDMGAVGGTWPGTLYVETFRLGSGDGFTTSFILRGDDRRVTVVRRSTGSYLLPPAIWKGGALLSVRADGHSGSFGSPLNRTARFEVLGPTKTAAPQLPKDALVDDAFVAYPNGFVFVLGGRRSRPVIEAEASEYEQEHHYMLDGAMVWQNDGGTTTLQPVQLPGTTARDRLYNGRLAAGQTAQETLVFGMLEIWRDRQSTTEPYLARFGTTGWRRIPLELPVLRIATGRDGTTWAVIGSDGFANTDESFLARVTLDVDGGVHFVRVPLLPDPKWNTLDAQTKSLLRGCKKLRPRELAVVDETDRWLTAQCLSGQDYAPTVLLHTQVQKPLIIFPSLDQRP